MNQNFIEHLFIESINIMKTDKWQWPENWSIDRRIKFLDDAMKFAEGKELYEQCAIIRDVKETIQT